MKKYNYSYSVKVTKNDDHIAVSDIIYRFKTLRKAEDFFNETKLQFNDNFKKVFYEFDDMKYYSKIYDCHVWKTFGAFTNNNGTVMSLFKERYKV